MMSTSNVCERLSVCRRCQQCQQKFFSLVWWVTLMFVRVCQHVDDVNHGLLNLQDGTLIWRRMNSYTLALEGQNVCDVAIECDHFSRWDGLIKERKNALTKKEVTLDLWNLDTAYSGLYSTPSCSLFFKRPRYRRYTGEQLFHKKISFETACASPQKCVFLFCPFSRFFTLEMY